MATSRDDDAWVGSKAPGWIKTRLEFAYELTVLRERAGLTVRDVATITGIQASTMGGYFSGRHVPALKPPTVLIDILKACGVKGTAEIEAWMAALARVRRLPGPRPASLPLPYRGLESYRPNDGEWFFGREALTELLAARVTKRCVDGGLVMVVGPSGSGKSSLLQAGLLAGVVDGSLAPGSQQWPWVLFTPGEHPLQALVRQLHRAAVTGASDAAWLTDADPDGASRVIDSIPAMIAACGGRAEGTPVDSFGHARTLLIVVDQFEEVFSLHVAEDERQAFIGALLSAGRYTRGAAPAEHGPVDHDPVSTVVVVLGMRADFYAQAIRYTDLVPALQDELLVVGPMTPEELRRVIVEPANKARTDVGEGLVEVILHDLAPTGAALRVGHDAGALPLLSHALLTTWQQGHQHALTIADYRASGGIRDAIARSAEHVFEALTVIDRDLARQLFLRLVHISDDAADTRRRATHAELSGGSSDTDEIRARVLRNFVDARLLTSDTDTIEITHEALLDAWPRLHEWIDTDRAGLRTYRQLTDAAREWRHSDRDSGALYRGTRLDLAREWAADPAHRRDLNELECEFLDHSIRHDLDERQTRKRRSRRLHQLVVSLTVLLLVAAITTGLALQQRAGAQRASRVAERVRDVAISRQVAGDANDLRASDPALAGQLALAAFRVHATPEARSNLLEAAAGPLATRIRASTSTMAVAVAADRLMAVGDADGNIRLWNIATSNRPRRVGAIWSGAHATLFAAALRPDGRMLAVGGTDATLSLWDIADPDHPAPLPTPTGITSTVYALAFSPDGTSLVAGTDTQGVLVWDLRDPTTPHRLPGPPHDPAGPVHALAISPDGRLLAAAGADNMVRLWNDHATRFTEAGSTRGPTGTVYSLAFSPHSDTVAAASADRSVYLWKLRQPAPPERIGPPLGQFTAYVNTVAFSPDGTRLSAGGADGSVLIWNLPSRRLLQQLPHPGPVTTTVFLTGDALLTGAADGYARIWPLPGAVLTAANSVFTVAFTPHSHMLAVNSESSSTIAGAVDWWNVADTHHATPAAPSIPSPAGPGRFCGAAALSPDGNILAVGGLDGSTRLWNVSNPSQPQQLGQILRGPIQLIEALAFSPDSRTLAVGGDDHTIWMWDLTTPDRPRRLATLTDPTNLVFGLAFDPSGRLLAAASADRDTYLYNVSDPAHPKFLHQLTGPASYAYTVAFSPNDRVLAVGSADKTIRLWNITNPADPHQIGQPLTGPTNYIYSVAFNPDGTVLASGSTDGSVWLWNISRPQTPQAVATLRTAPAVFTIAFSRDGNTIAAGAADGSVHLWQTDPTSAAATICSAGGEPITRDEWQLYLPGVAYQPPCA